MDDAAKPLLAGDPRALGAFQARARLAETPAGVILTGEWAGEVAAVAIVLRPSVALDEAALDRFEYAVEALPEVLDVVTRGLVAWAAVPAEARDAAEALLKNLDPDTKQNDPQDDDLDLGTKLLGIGCALVLLSWPVLLIYALAQWLG